MQERYQRWSRHPQVSRWGWPLPVGLPRWPEILADALLAGWTRKITLRWVFPRVSLSDARKKALRAAQAVGSRSGPIRLIWRNAGGTSRSSRFVTNGIFSKSRLGLRVSGERDQCDHNKQDSHQAARMPRAAVNAKVRKSSSPINLLPGRECGVPRRSWDACRGELLLEP